ncbi:hypothetical protein Tco_1189631 [Tanacetum coccineum]
MLHRTLFVSLIISTDLWVKHMWHVRPENANWAMGSTYFVQLLMQNGMPLFYANSDKYATPSSEVDQLFKTDNKRDCKLVREMYVMCQEWIIRCQERREQMMEMQRFLFGSNVAVESFKLLKDL